METALAFADLCRFPPTPTPTPTLTLTPTQLLPATSSLTASSPTTPQLPLQFPDVYMCKEDLLATSLHNVADVESPFSLGKMRAGRRHKPRHTMIFRGFGLPTAPIYYQYLLLHHLEAESATETVLPSDPRTWTKCDVRRWVCELNRHHDISPPLDVTKFPFNGKALCTLTLEMLQTRAPLYGKLLYKDVRLRLAKAVNQTE